jgi:hypothetical protein
VSLVTTGNNSADQFGREGNGNYPWWGDLAELAIYDRPLSASERVAVENYFRIKYWTLTATAGPGNVALTWAPRPNAARYDVERSATAGSGYATIATGLLGTTYTDTAVASLTTYYYRVVAVDASGNRFPSREASGTPLFVGTGTGLTGTYYNTINLTGSPVMTRIDPVIDFGFGTGSPDPVVNPDNFSVRWTGQVQAPMTGDFVFSTNSDDGVRLRVNGQLVIDNWTNHGDTQNTSAPIHLEVGQKYDLNLEYYESTSGAVIRLKWSYLGQALQTVPQTQLYP